MNILDETLIETFLAEKQKKQVKELPDKSVRHSTPIYSSVASWKLIVCEQHCLTETYCFLLFQQIWA